MHELSYDFFAMNSDCRLRLWGADPDETWRVARAAEAEVRRIEARYSRFLPDSDLSQINAIAEVGGEIAVDEETAGLIMFAMACHFRSGGAFDITAGVLRRAWDVSRAQLPTRMEIERLLPRVGLDKVRLDGMRLSFETPEMALDFGGMGKEYAADRAAEVCQAMGCRSGLVDLAGDIRVIGPRPDGGPWKIGVRSPGGGASAIPPLDLAKGAVATSGDYEKFIEVDGRRYSHILDPRTGWPASGTASATVIADRCLTAGALATSAMVKGSEASDWLAHQAVGWILIDDKGRVKGTA